MVVGVVRRYESPAELVQGVPGQTGPVPAPFFGMSDQQKFRISQVVAALTFEIGGVLQVARGFDWMLHSACIGKKSGHVDWTATKLPLMIHGSRRSVPWPVLVIIDMPKLHGLAVWLVSVRDSAMGT